KLSNDEFFRLMSQSLNTQSKSPDEILSDQLIKRSHDAFTLALEVYNRPTLGNRVEAFTIMMVNCSAPVRLDTSLSDIFLFKVNWA
ncbi:hypothetical protein P3695_26605, partial [Vibrio parahaemolyticus]|nr:hypothetical protein [Vibrio parahaemolyticus]